jgi:archaellum biogenesis ATPase FlaH
MNLETTILRNLIQDESFMRKTIPHLKSKYFDGAHKVVFDGVVDFVNKYEKVPNEEALSIEMKQKSDIPGDLVPETFSIIGDLASKTDEVDGDWLLQKTEKWCQDRSIFLAIMDSINIIDGKHESLTKNALPELLSEALSITFDTNVGHDYIDNANERYDFYHRTEEHLPFDLEMFNTITKGGLVNKSLNVALAGTGVGKSLFMCHVSAAALSQHKNVLYITMEMSEERVAERIDANLMNVPIDKLTDLSREAFDNKVNNINKKGVGKLIIKEYPTGAANVGHFRALLTELKLKRSFIPDLICVDYLNICSSARMKMTGDTYTYVKAIAEELRGLAVENNVPVLTATQTTRSGYDNSDVGLTDTSESFGLPATADLMFALISTEELEGLNQIMVKQLKNRYNDPTGTTRRFVLGVDRAKMRLYDVEDSAQTLSTDQVSSSGGGFEGFKI